MSEHEPRIVVEGVSKKFARSLKRSFVYGGGDIVRSVLGRPFTTKLRPSEFWALRDISFELGAGKSVGIVGVNGSGKTTLLRIISGILKPTSGKVTVNGQIAPMLALGAGFKMELTGRENVFLNMSLLGMSEKYIRAKYDEVLDFADIGEAIEAPIGTYSTGMRMRLGFACAVMTQPEILIVDEVLAVGDTRFRVKCRNKLNELKREGVSILLVSHSAISVETLCDDCLYIRKGRSVAFGPSREVLKQFQADAIAQTAEANRQAVEGAADPAESGPFSVADLSLFDASGAASETLVCGETGGIAFELHSSAPRSDVSVNLIAVDQTHNQGENAQFIMSRADVGSLDVPAGTSSLRLSLNPVVLRAGTYRLKISVSQGAMDDILYAADSFKLIVTDPKNRTKDMIYQPRSWTFGGEPLSAVTAGEMETDDEEMF